MQRITHNHLYRIDCKNNNYILIIQVLEEVINSQWIIFFQTDGMNYIVMKTAESL